MKYKDSIYVHIPKCGGSSIRRLGGSIRRLGVKVHGHNLRDLEYEYFKTTYIKVSSIFSFTFVRNPWDRLVSAYTYLQKGGNSPSDAADYKNYIHKYCNFKDMIHNWDDKITNQIHFKSQHKWICDDHDNVLVDFVGRFENLQQDFNTICDKIGIPRQQLPHYNKTRHKHYTEYYDDETRQIVAERYAKDIERFDYEFGE